ncbi:YgaP family membrane protein [Roseibium aestuarii]|uniref:DUF2892 domain-containing protein n=1 Tax=Roseibium aestuarii TaxID=2600299 RepID=A0ABW4JWP9_9HYPH|nr:DUF2892 domain-containing protein [Roseibium aestuarii]
MTRNMGIVDRALRVIAAALLIYAALVLPMLGHGILHWLALAVAAIFLLTSVVGNCPLYSLVGLKTCRDC